jgi:hypothetical protein
MSDAWYYAENDEAVGPLTLVDLKKQLSLVSNANDVLVWRAGFANWQRAESVSDLALLPASKPPPIPPSVGRTTASPIQTATSFDVQVQSTIQKIERERNQQLVIARSWVVLLSVITAIGLGLGLVTQLNLDLFIAAVLAVVAGLLLGRILAFFVGIVLGRRAARKLRLFAERAEQRAAERLANLPPKVKQDIIDNAPPDIKQRVADTINKN